MTALTKADISHNLQKKFGLNKAVANDIVDQIFEEMRLALESGCSLKLSGLGNFDLRDKKSRPGRNPKTKEPKVIQARRVVTFKAGQKLKTKMDAINGIKEKVN